MASDKKAILDAIAKYGSSVDHIAARYTNPVTGRALSGRALLAKLLEVESNALSNPEKARGAVSYAGAKAWGQFMPGSRQEAITKFGLDPWRSPDEAVHATTLHLRGKINGKTGLEGYNPGDAENYTRTVLERRVGGLTGDVLSGTRAKATSGGAPAGGAIRGASVSQQAPSGFTGAAGSSLMQQLELATAPAPAPSAGVPAPAFAAAPVMAGPGVIPQGGGPAPPPDLELPEPTVTELPGGATTTVEAGSLPTGMMPVNERSENARLAEGELSPLHPGGGYEGTQGLARHARYRAEKEGWTVTSSKRATKSTATGGTSDHWQGKGNAWAYDFGNGTATANDGGRKLARDIAGRYGVKFVENSYDSGGMIRVGDHRFRIQILYGDDVDHGDHVHVGFERVK